MATRRIGLLKQLWHDKPDIAASLCIFMTGPIAVAIYAMRYDRDLFHKHKWEYTVIREDEADKTAQAKGVYN